MMDNMKIKLEPVHIFVEDQRDLLRMVEKLGRLSGAADDCSLVCPFSAWCLDTESCAETIYRLAYGEITDNEEDLQ